MVYEAKQENNPKYGIDILDFYKDDFIRGVNNKKYPMPAVSRTKRFFKINHQQVIFSRKNIFIRDNFTCQYCNREYNHTQLTYDHVIPKSKWNWDHGSPTIWTNIVTACVDCNRKKGNRTPKQANMTLQNIPIKPNKNPKYLPISMHIAKIKEQIPEEWKTYLPRNLSFTMPTYTYGCLDCKSNFELFFYIKDYQEYPKCINCGSKKTNRSYVSDVRTQSSSIKKSDSELKTLGDLAKRNSDRLSDDEKKHLYHKHNSYKEEQSDKKLPTGMSRIEKPQKPKWPGSKNKSKRRLKK